MVSRFKVWFTLKDAKTLAKAVLVAGPAIYFILWGLFSLSSMVTNFLGLPSNLNVHPALRFVGGAMLVGGLLLAVWLLRYRRPSTMIVSTYFTFVKMLTRAPVSKLGGRAEPLIVSGPQQYVRHPLYLAATAAFLGWGLVTGATSTLLGVVFMLLWFRFVQIPFEERELVAIFGDQYVRYSDQVPQGAPQRREDIRHP